MKEDRGLSLEASHDVDIPINQVGRIERGEINTTNSTANAIAKALKISLAVINHENFYLVRSLETANSDSGDLSLHFLQKTQSK